MLPGIHAKGANAQFEYTSHAAPVQKFLEFFRKTFADAPENLSQVWRLEKKITKRKIRTCIPYLTADLSCLYRIILLTGVTKVVQG